MPKLTSCLQLKKLSKDNWDAWHQGLNLVGFLTMVHSFFPAMFLKSMVGTTQQAEAQPGWRAWLELSDGGADDEQTSERDALEPGEVAKALRIAAKFWQQRNAWHDLYLLRLALDAQVDIMDRLLSSTSSTSALDRAMSNPGDKRKQHALLPPNI